MAPVFKVADTKHFRIIVRDEVGILVAELRGDLFVALTNEVVVETRGGGQGDYYTLL
jgi:hypothetical protein